MKRKSAGNNKTSEEATVCEGTEETSILLKLNRVES